MTRSSKRKSPTSSRAPLPPVPAALKAWLAVPPSAARVLAAMFAARGEVVPRGDLMASGGQTRAGLELSIKILRAAMDAAAIVNVPTVGFRLTSSGVAECERAVADAALDNWRAA